MLVSHKAFDANPSNPISNADPVICYLYRFLLVVVTGHTERAQSTSKELPLDPVLTRDVISVFFFYSAIIDISTLECQGRKYGNGIDIGTRWTLGGWFRLWG